MCEKVKMRTKRASSARVFCAMMRNPNFILKAMGLGEGTQKSFKEEAPCCTLHFGNLGPTWERLAKDDSLQTGS